MALIENGARLTSFFRKLVDVSGSLRLTIPRPIVQSFDYRPDETVKVYAPNEKCIVIERCQQEKRSS